LDPQFWRELKGLTESPLLPIMLFGMFSQAFGQASLYSAFSLFCEKVWGMDAPQVSQQFLFIGVVAIVTQGGLIRPLTKHFSETGLYTWGSALMALGLAMIPFMPTLPLL
ncbi:MFS transporter, partial [Arthrospira platensis SPKY1]|nr:MFS transporter [Arthrospira platensis SPKY1]